MSEHMEIAAKTFALDKAREIAGVAVDAVLNYAQVTVTDLSPIGEAEKHLERFLAAWLKNNLLEFARTYYSAEEQSVRRIVAESNTELLDALEDAIYAMHADTAKQDEAIAKAEAAIRKAKGE